MEDMPRNPMTQESLNASIENDIKEIELRLKDCKANLLSVENELENSRKQQGRDIDDGAKLLAVMKESNIPEEEYKTWEDKIHDLIRMNEEHILNVEESLHAIQKIEEDLQALFERFCAMRLEDVDTNSKPN